MASCAGVLPLGTVRIPVNAKLPVDPDKGGSVTTPSKWSEALVPIASISQKPLRGALTPLKNTGLTMTRYAPGCVIVGPNIRVVVAVVKSKPPPAAPVAPVGPVAPDAPSLPAGPCAPVGPVAPDAPSLPAGPCAPVGPVAPSLPGSPCGPGSPRAPVAPAAPAGPVCSQAIGVWWPLHDADAESMMFSCVPFVALAPFVLSSRGLRPTCRGSTPRRSHRRSAPRLRRTRQRRGACRSELISRAPPFDVTGERQYRPTNVDAAARPRCAVRVGLDGTETAWPG
jgi:hypothetical protein